MNLNRRKFLSAAAAALVAGALPQSHGASPEKAKKINH